MKTPTKYTKVLEKIKLDQDSIKFVKNSPLRIKKEQHGINLKLKECKQKD